MEQLNESMTTDSCKIAGCQFIANSQDIIVWWRLPTLEDAASLDQDCPRIDRCQIEVILPTFKNSNFKYMITNYRLTITDRYGS